MPVRQGNLGPSVVMRWIGPRPIEDCNHTARLGAFEVEGGTTGSHPFHHAFVRELRLVFAAHFCHLFQFAGPTRYAREALVNRTPRCRMTSPCAVTVQHGATARW